MAAKKKIKPEDEMGKPKRKKLPMLPLSKPATPRDIIDKARQYGPACVEALADEVANGEGSARISAANSLLERGYGKIGQPIELTGADGGPVPLELGVSPAIAAALNRLRGVSE